MARDATVTLTRTAYDALMARNEELEDRLDAIEADDGSRIPHAVALAIMRGERPLAAFRSHRSLTLRGLAARTGIAASYLVRNRTWTQTGLGSSAGPHRHRTGHHGRRPAERRSAGMKSSATQWPLA